MIVCIAEKPSVAKEIAQVLGAGIRRDGYYESDKYQVTWTFGHLCTLKEPGDYTPLWKSWSLGNLPIIPPRFGIKLITDKGIEKQFKVIESLIQKADTVVNCGDAGQEGELIQRWVMQKAGIKCPVKRLWISSLTEESIREGFDNLRDQDNFQTLYEAGLCRAIGDWLLGINATRLYTLKYRGYKEKKVLSIGRVQTPTLALIVKRQQEIDQFIPEQYRELKTRYRDTLFSAVQGRIKNQEKGEELLRKIIDCPFTITAVKKREGREYSPKLFDLTSLQVECNRKFGFSADDTLKLIQSLYEKKITTYPRVDTTYLSEDLYQKCPAILKGLKSYSQFTSPLENKKLAKSKRIFDNSKITDHHAIIPTGVISNSLLEKENMVFDLVARRFIASFYPESLFSTTTVLGQVESVEFKTSGKEIITPGWRVLFDKDKSDDQEKDEKEDERTLPSFTVKESGPHSPELQEKWTQPPRPYTEATLLRTMETAGKLVENDDLREALKENGIGRPSTRAAIIETLFKRDYMRKANKNLIPTSTGIELIGLIRQDLLKSAELTGIWEKKIRGIENSKYSPEQFVSELKTLVIDIVRQVLSDNSSFQ